MNQYRYRTRGVCSREIQFESDGKTVDNIRFISGCSGNTQGVAALANGMEIEKVIRLLEGIDCNGRGTSCPAQLANALKEVQNQEGK